MWRLATVAVAVAAVLPGAPPVRTATPADDVSHAADKYHDLRDCWTMRAGGVGLKFVLIKVCIRPTPTLEITFRNGPVYDTVYHPMLYVQPHSGPGFTLARLPDNGPPEPVTLRYAAGKYIFDSAYPGATGHLVLTPTARGVTVGPWRLPKVGVAGPPPIPIAGTMTWNVLVPAGRANGWLQVDDHRIEVGNWSAYHDHLWGAFDRPNWYHADFALLTRGGQTWILNGLEPGGYNKTYRPKGDDTRWHGVLVHVAGGRTTACAAHLKRSGWVSGRPLGRTWDYEFPKTLTASCGSTTLTIHQGRTMFGVDSVDGIVRTYTHLTPEGGWLLHTTPEFG
jgi:hypothetical protein